MERMYDLLQQVGEGSFGQVFKARRKYDGAIVAYKVTKKKGRSNDELQSLRGECKVQEGLHHPNIIQMLDSFETEKEIVVVTEYVDIGLYEILGRAGKLSEERTQVIACDLVSALNYLHSNKVIHRDMKPQNILLDTNGVAKLCDFGFARIMSTDIQMSIKGTPLYMAPELINECPYDHNVDLWSLGCIVYELVTGEPPFQTSSIIHLLSLIRHDDIKWPHNISTNCKSFLQGLLQKDPSQRLTWPDLLEHPFVRGRILIINENIPRPLTSPLSLIQARAKQQQQLQSLASRLTSQSKKLLEKQIKKLHSQVLRKGEPSDSESSTSIDVLLNNLSLRTSLSSDVFAADSNLCQEDCAIIEKETQAKQQKQQSSNAHIENVEDQVNCFNNVNISENQFSELPPCCLAALQQNNPCVKTAWQLDDVNAATAYCLAMQNNGKSESYCMSTLHNTDSISCNSKSLDEFNNHRKRTTSSRRMSEYDRNVVMNSMMQRQARLFDWIPCDNDQWIENEEWVVFLQQSMEEIMDGEIGSLLQENCMSIFIAPLKNPAASSHVIEYISCLVALPFVVESVTNDDLERIQQVYLNVKVVPNLVYAVKLLMSERYCVSETDASSSIATNKWRSTFTLSADELKSLERTILVLCRLVHTKQEYLMQFCDAVFLVPDGLELFQNLFNFEKRKAGVVSDFIAMMSQVLRSHSGNAELVDRILLKNKSTDDLIDIFTKLMIHKQPKIRSRICILLLLLGEYSPKTLQRIWGKSLRNLLNNLTNDKEKSVQHNANEAISSLIQLSFYDQDKDSWSVIES